MFFVPDIPVDEGRLCPGLRLTGRMWPNVDAAAWAVLRSSGRTLKANLSLSDPKAKPSKKMSNPPPAATLPETAITLLSVPVPMDECKAMLDKGLWQQALPNETDSKSGTIHGEVLLPTDSKMLFLKPRFEPLGPAVTREGNYDKLMLWLVAGKELQFPIVTAQFQPLYDYIPLFSTPEHAMTAFLAQKEKHGERAVFLKGTFEPFKAWCLRVEMEPGNLFSLERGTAGVPHFKLQGEVLENALRPAGKEEIPILSSEAGMGKLVS